MSFVDEIQLKVTSGHGGPGRVSFRREAKNPRGGPDGGDGGAGGDVIFRTNPNLNSLLHLKFKKVMAAENGFPGQNKNMTGRDGQSLEIEVPYGTLIKDMNGHILADLSDANPFILLKGGRGGKGNAFFKTSVNQAPTHAQPGEPEQVAEIQLELKLIAHVGLIGFPNAGKSTLISRISAARPKIADYPFSTLVPHLGVVRLDEERTFVVADIPGLVPGAHKGVGLGVQFLRHIERTKLFVHLIDLNPLSGRNPVEDIVRLWCGRRLLFLIKSIV
jgi:GTP-binding protein